MLTPTSLRVHRAEVTLPANSDVVTVNRKLGVWIKAPRATPRSDL